MTIIYFILVLGITIFVHELGHFIFAKRAGIYVYEFSLGMGPKIFKFQRKNDETIYAIRLFPIGGFVQMAGEEIETDEKIPIEKRMQSKTWFQKFLTVIAGVTFNFIFAIIILFIVGLINGSPINKPIINDVAANIQTNEVLMKNDLIVKVNNKNIKTTDRFMLEYQVSYGKDLKLTVLRNGEEINIDVTPTKEENGKEVTYQYGFSLINEVEDGFLPALKYAFLKFGSIISQMFFMIVYLINGTLSIANLSGPIGIFNIVGESAKAGLINLVYLLGYISINVGFINLLPIPAMDGGRIFFMIIEKIIRRPINHKVENTIHAVGLILLMVLMVVISYNDIIRFIIK